MELTADELAAADAVVMVTDHDAFDYDLVRTHARYVLDTRNRLDGPTSSGCNRVPTAADPLASTGAGSDVKVVVTGGAGFIGANLCRALAGADRHRRGGGRR